MQYLASIAQLAQGQRHRPIKCCMRLLDDPKFYVPKTIEECGQTDEWLQDMNSLAEYYPQGMMVLVTERGFYDDLISKLQERACSAAQLEVSIQCRKTLRMYMENVREKNVAVYNELYKCDCDSRCGFDDDYHFQCLSPCKWGKNQLDRLF